MNPYHHHMRSAETLRWHALPAAEVLQRLHSDPRNGLSAAEAAHRLERYGLNRPRRAAPPTYLGIFVKELREPMILLLIATGILYGLWGQAGDVVTIFFVISALVAAEVFTEYRAKRAIAALSRLAEPLCTVIRNGSAVDAAPESLVPGDIIAVRAGHRVPADARIVQAWSLSVDESMLTGESVAALKDAGAVLDRQSVLAERTTMLYAGTMVAAGHGIAVVVATGPASELGRLAELAQAVKPPRTPLQRTMADLSGWLAWFAIGISVLVPFLGWAISHQPVRTMVLTALSLAFAMIPEELPIVITMVLALGAWRLARRHAIVKRLPAVETLGAVTVIVTDKTGTLTENRMEVAELQPPEQRRRVLEIGARCNDALQSGEDFSGDPIETALLRAASAAGIDTAQLRGETLVLQEHEFDGARKLMSVVWTPRAGGTAYVALKGAPETVLAISTLDAAQRAAVMAAADGMARAGMRVLAFAERALEAGAGTTRPDVERGVTFVGLAAFADPPRPEAKAAIAACAGAGIRPIMVTGDHALTAAAIAQAVGLDARGHALSGSQLDALSDAELARALERTAVVSRSSPHQKLRIVQALQRSGERVAVTGDGSNDAPALAAADIGVAMGETGTDVARDAAALVLADDNFATIVNAVAEGRVLFDNLRKGVRYYLTCKLALLGAVLLPVLLRAPVPFAPVQIILMELFMDLAASAAFVAEPAEPDVMRRPPRDPRAPFMNRDMVGGIFGAAFGLFAAVTIVYLTTWYSSGDVARSQTLAFTTWLFGHVALALTMRSERAPLLSVGWLNNRVIVAWALVTIAFVAVATLVPWVRAGLQLAPLHTPDVALSAAFALLAAAWAELFKALRVTAARFRAHQAPTGDTSTETVD